jgi:hypothetical protein
MTKAETEQAVALVRTLVSHMADVEMAAAMEEWELICEERGWVPAVPAPPCLLPPGP